MQVTLGVCSKGWREHWNAVNINLLDSAPPGAAAVHNDALFEKIHNQTLIFELQFKVAVRSIVLKFALQELYWSHLEMYFVDLYDLQLGSEFELLQIRIDNYPTRMALSQSQCDILPLLTANSCDNTKLSWDANAKTFMITDLFISAAASFLHYAIQTSLYSLIHPIIYTLTVCVWIKVHLSIFSSQGIQMGLMTSSPLRCSLCFIARQHVSLPSDYPQNVWCICAAFETLHLVLRFALLKLNQLPLFMLFCLRVGMSGPVSQCFWYNSISHYSQCFRVMWTCICIAAKANFDNSIMYNDFCSVGVLTLWM